MNSAKNEHSMYRIIRPCNLCVHFDEAAAVCKKFSTPDYPYNAYMARLEILKCGHSGFHFEKKKKVEEDEASSK